MAQLSPEKYQALLDKGLTPEKISAIAAKRGDSLPSGTADSRSAPSAPIGYSGAPDLPLNSGNNLIDTAIANPIETSQLLAGIPGMVRAIPAIGSAVGRAGIEGAGELAALGRGFASRIPIFGGAVREAAKPIARTLETELADAATIGAHASDAGRILRAHGLAQRAASVAQEAAPAASKAAQAGESAAAQSATRTLGDQGSSVEKFAQEVAPQVEKSAIGQAAKRTVKAGAKGKPAVGSAESRVKPDLKIVPKRTSEAVPGSRHDVQYYSASRGQHVNIEDMNQKHIEQAFNKLAAKNPKPESVAAKQMEALLKESIHRLQTTGIHIGQGGS